MKKLYKFWPFIHISTLKSSSNVSSSSLNDSCVSQGMNSSDELPIYLNDFDEDFLSLKYKEPLKKKISESSNIDVSKVPKFHISISKEYLIDKISNISDDADTSINFFDIQDVRSYSKKSKFMNDKFFNRNDYIQSSFEEFFEHSPNEPLSSNSINNCSDTSETNFGIDQQRNFQIKFGHPDTLKTFQIFYDLSEFISKLIYFSGDFYQFINSHFLDSNDDGFKIARSNFRHNNLETGSSLGYHTGSNEKVKNLIFLIYSTIDLAQQNNNFVRSPNINFVVSKRILKCKKTIDDFNSKLNDQKLDDKELLHLIKKIKLKNQIKSDLELERKNSQARPSISKISNYMIDLFSSNRNFKNFNTKWFTIFCSLTKISNFYDSKLKEFVNGHLDKFRCPIYYKNKELLMSQNAYIDIDSFIFVILDWIFYFFSPDFVEIWKTKTNDSSKVFSKVTALLFILFNKPQKVKLFLSENRFFDEWIVNLETYFESEVVFNSLSDTFKALYDEIQQSNGFTYMTERQFYSKLFSPKKLAFLVKSERLVQEYLFKLYETVYLIQETES